MNESVLYMAISKQLHTHVRLLDAEANVLQTYTVRNNLHDILPQSKEVAKLICGLETFPQMCTVNDLLTYFSIPMPHGRCVLGPLGVCSDCLLRHQLPTLLIPDELISVLYTASSTELIHTGLFLFNLFSEPMDILTCFTKNCIGHKLPDDTFRALTDSLFQHEEYGNSHNSYEAERREMISIEKGNISQLQECWNEENGNLGRLSLEPVRNAKYLCIINIALSARAAVRGGIPCELAYALCDTYCQQIDGLTEQDLPQVEGIVRNIQLTFTKLVSQQSKGSGEKSAETSYLVEKAKNYIFSHLHGKLTVNAVAESLKTHPVYLGRLFKEAEGITVHDYILREKVNLACNMLTYSDYSYIEIANYLGFSTQSHLGSNFKKFTGMTLKQYKDAYHKE